MRVVRETLALLLGLAAAATATKVVRHDHHFHPDHILRVTAKNYTEACDVRYSVLINGSSPGPELRLREGKTSWIRVYNDIPDLNTTIHWHGLTAYTAPFSDGTPAGSQWPIPPGHFFDYEVKPEAGSAGTYFYHSHVGFQAVTAKGPLIVDSCDPPPYDYDEERTLLIADYFNETDAQIEAGLVSTNFTWSGETDGILVNGHGRQASNQPGSCRLADIALEAGKTYRLRLIGGTALSLVSIAFEGHDVSIIEADGHYTKPYKTDFLQIGSGQRYSVLLKAKSKAELAKAHKRQFYIQITTLERPAVLTNFAVLSYTAKPDLKTVPPRPPLPVASAVQGWLDYELQPLHPDHDFPRAEEVTRRIVIDVHQNVSDHIIWLQNGYDWIQSYRQTPYLVDIYNNKLDLDAAYDRALSRGAGFGFDNITRTFPARIGEVLEIVWQNRGAFESGALDAHPFHAHGRHFYDLGGGDGLYNLTANEERLKGTHPIQRDTTLLYRYREKTNELVPSGWRAWRIRVTDAGVWMFHCHILQHMVMGMQTVFTFGDRDDILAQSGPVNEGYLVYGGSAYGNATRAPLAQHFKD